MIGETLSYRKHCGMTVYIGRTFPPLKSLPVNVGLWWRCTETTSLWERVQRVQEWVGIHHEDYTFQPGRSRTCEHSPSGGTSFGKPSRHNSRFIHCTGVICENCSQHCPFTAGIQQCVRMVATKKCDGSSQKFSLQVLFHFFSHIKEEQTGSLNPWWCCETWVHHFTQNEL